MNEEKSTKLIMTAESYGYKYSAEGPDDMNLDRLLGRVVVPLLLNMGYHRTSIEKLFVDGMPTDWDTAYAD